MSTTTSNINFLPLVETAARSLSIGCLLTSEFGFNAPLGVQFMALRDGLLEPPDCSDTAPQSLARVYRAAVNNNRAFILSRGPRLVGDANLTCPT